MAKIRDGMNESSTKYSAYLAGLPDAIYWPFKRLPEYKLEVYAAACVDTVLMFSKEAQEIYTGIIQLWELSGCQALIADYTQCKQDTRTYLRNRAASVVRNESLPSMPDVWIEVIKKHEGNADIHKLLKYVAFLIVTGFNRKVDLDNQSPKVIPRKSPYLAQTIVSCSLLDYLSKKPEARGSRVIDDDELAKLHWFCSIPASNPTNRKERRAKHKIVKTLRREDFTLHHYQTILDGAKIWYRARVLGNTAREAADYYRIDSTDLSKRIEPYDDATGWPRHR